MRKQLANKIIREGENNYYFFTSAGIYRTVDKETKEAKKLTKCDINSLVENLFNKKFDDIRLTDILARLKPGDTIETFERYLNPEKYLAYRVLKENIESGENIYYYFDNKGIFTKSPYLVPLMFPINNIHTLVSYVLGIKVEKNVFQRVIRNLQIGCTLQDFEEEILKNITPKETKRCWYKKLFHLAHRYPFNKGL